MIGDIGIPELLIILAVVMLLFGAGKISSLGKDLGTSVKEFKKAIKDEDAENGAKPGATSSATPTYQVMDAQPQQQYVAQPRRNSTCRHSRPCNRRNRPSPWHLHRPSQRRLLAARMFSSR